MDELKGTLKKAGLNERGRTAVPVGSVAFGRRFVLIAGPCSVENWKQIVESARAVKAAGADMLRGGAYKTRTSPYSFQGLGKEGLAILKAAGEETGLPVVTEVIAPGDVELVCRYADMLQIGARNMQNVALLREVGRGITPVLLKRAMSATLEELLNSAEYILSEGNSNVVLCERGIRTFDTYTRNTLDLSAVPALKGLTRLPIIVDPSHGTGRVPLIEPMSLAAAAAGADGLMIEVHCCPSEALSDGAQALTPAQFGELAGKVRALRRFMDDEMGMQKEAPSIEGVKPKVADA